MHELRIMDSALRMAVKYAEEQQATHIHRITMRIGDFSDVAIEALRAYRERTRKPDYQALSRFAKVDRVEKVMRPYLESVG